MNQKGQSLIEAVVALGIAVLIISAIAIAVITAVGNSDFAKLQNQATAYAQQGLELVKAKAQANWSSFNTYGGSYCLADGSTILSVAINGCTTQNVPNVNSFFVRGVQLAKLSANCPGATKGTDVTVSVSWRDGKCTDANHKYCHSASVETCLYDINAKPTL